ncbi:MAG: hypothetical protein VYD64_07065 [Pseudomonadota bacterium]|nr:hypothetical protein [Pseudomonadota bacterium]
MPLPAPAERALPSARAFVHAAFFAVALLAGSVPAHAIDGAALMERYKEKASKHGAIVAYDSLEATGDDSFTLHNLSLQGPEMADPLRLYKVTVRGARDVGEGGFSADAITFSGLNFSTMDKEGRETTFTVDAGEGSGIYFPNPADFAAPLIAYDRSSLEIGNIKLLINGNPALSIDMVSGETAIDKQTNIARTEVQIGPITFHVENIADLEAKNRFAELGIETIRLSIGIDGSWNMESGNLDLRDYTIDAPQFGKLTMGWAIDGYTEKVATALRNAMAELNATDEDDSEARKAATRKLMDLLGRLKLVRGKISYVDNSFAGLVLDLKAKEMDIGRQDLVAGVADAARGMAQALDDPEFLAILDQAIRAFLSDPKSLQIKLEPQAPVAVTDIFGAAILSPGTLIEKLGVKIVANE